MSEHNTGVKWIVGVGVALLSAGGGIVALLDYWNRPKDPTVTMSVLENSIDRYGGEDYSNFTAVDVNACSDMCLADPVCKAFSFNINANQCWLKSDVPLRVENSGFISGVKTIGPN